MHIIKVFKVQEALEKMKPSKSMGPTVFLLKFRGALGDLAIDCLT